jgi:hypothetical protein
VRTLHRHLEKAARRGLLLCDAREASTSLITAACNPALAKLVKSTSAKSSKNEAVLPQYLIMMPANAGTRSVEGGIELSLYSRSERGRPPEFSYQIEPLGSV